MQKCFANLSKNSLAMQNPKEYLNTSECAALIGRSPGAVRNLVLRRLIPFRKPAGRLVFVRSEIIDWIEGAPGLRYSELRGGYDYS
jgi:hypothetical protein